MSSKTIVVVVLVVLAIFGLYFYSGGGMETEKMTTPAEKSTLVSEVKTETVQAPVKTSSTDEIVDYLVDGLSGEEKKTATNAIDTTSAPSQAEAGSSLNTNF